MRNFPTHFWTRFTGDTYKERVAFQQIAADGVVVPTTYWVWTRRVQNIAVGLLDAGFQPGERLAMVAPNSPEWLDLAFAVWMVGGVLVPLPSNWDRKTTLRCLARAGAGWVAVKDSAARREIRGQAQNLPPLKWVVLQEDESTLEDVTTIGELATQGRFRAKRGDLKTLAKITYNLEPADPAVIFYPVSEVDDPHGAVFTGGKLAVMLEYLAEGYQFEDDTLAVLLSYGWFHGFLTAIAALVSGQTLAIAESLTRLRGDIETLAPTLLCCGPAFVEALGADFQGRLDSAPEILKKVQEGEAGGFGALKRLGERAARKVLYDPVRAEMGGKVSRIYLVDGQVPDEVFEVLEQAHLEILGMWGVPEAGISHIERSGAGRRHSVGRPLQGFTAKVRGKAEAKGELLIRSDVLFDGYWDKNGPRRIDDEGFLETGIDGRIESAYLFV